MRLVATVVAVLTSRVQGWGLCNDVDQSCAAWAKAGECDKGDHVKKLCPHSCAICTHLCRDTEESCLAWADNGQCDSNMDFMFKHCPVACGVCKTTRQKHSKNDLTEANQIAHLNCSTPLNGVSKTLLTLRSKIKTNV